MADIIPINKQVAVQMLRDDPALFIAKCFGHEIQPYQHDMLDALQERIRGDVWKDLHDVTMLGADDAKRRAELIDELSR